MTKLLTYCACLLATLTLQAQSFQEISTGASYRQQSFINLSTGAQSKVTANSWDIAFSVFGLQDAGIFVNESSSLGLDVLDEPIELYDAQTNNFSDQPNPAVFENFRLYNDEKSWNYGAFNNGRNEQDPFDYGWGKYNFQTNKVTGSKVFVLKLRNGDYRKIQIESLDFSTYTFRYAKLDGSEAVVKGVDKTDHPGKTLAYFSLKTGTTVEVEPETNFDLIFCRYNTPVIDTLTGLPKDYNVTGLLSARGVEVAVADGVNPLTVKLQDYGDQLSDKPDMIGYDWKQYVNGVWILDLNRVYFVKTANHRVWKLQFIDFEGSSTGTAVFEKTDLGLLSAVQTPGLEGVKANVFPNPVQSSLSLALDLPAGLPQEARLTVADLNGRPAFGQQLSLQPGFQTLQIPASDWNAGLYFIRLILPDREILLGKAIKI